MATQQATVESKSRGFSRRRSRGSLASGFLYAVALFLAIGFFLPFVWTLSSSLKTSGEIHDYPPSWLPKVPQFRNYVEVFTQVPLARWFFNTTFITVVSLVGIVSSASIVAFSFARFRYPGRDAMFLVTLSTMMLPSELLLIPQYLLFNKLGWLNTFKPLTIPHWFGGGAFNIFLLRQFFMTIPRDLDEAALIDGASYLRVFLSLIVPLSKPVLATVAVITFIARWNAFMGPLIFLDSADKLTLAVGLQFLQSAAGGFEEGEPRDHYLMAGAVMMSLPTIILFFSAQRYFVRGVVMSGIKG